MAEDQVGIAGAVRRGGGPVITPERSFAQELYDLYLAPASDPDFGVVLGQVRVETDSQVADLIEADGRIRLRLTKAVTLDRYLDAVPDLAHRIDPLDAAIDMSLRALARTGDADERAVQQLCDTYPMLSRSIRDAAALSNAVWSTQHIHKHVGRSSIKELPCDFGPVLEDDVQRYELRELLGEGAFGQVYLAVDRQLSEPGHPAFVSIKLLTGDDRSPRTRQHLIDEATKARRINHPNVAQVLDRGISAQNEDYLVHEFVGGGDLTRWSRRHGETIPVQAVVRMVARIARGVHAAHMAGLVHCDLKPSNVLLTADGEPKVADFGVAIRSDDHDLSFQADNGESAPVGNLAFMSPEQYRMDNGALTIPSDVYALGGILFWLLTGTLPNGVTRHEIRQTHDPVAGRTAPPPLRTTRCAVNHDLEAVCQRALAIRPEDRFSSAAEVAENLEAWLRREPIPWTGPSVLHRISLWIRRRPGLAITTAMIVILLVGGGVLLQQVRFGAALAKAELEAEETFRHKFRDNLRSTIARLKAARDQGLDHQVLPQIWLHEWLFGPEIFGKGDHGLGLWELRIQIIGDLLDKARARGGQDSFHTLLWESALSFWLINDGRYAEAKQLLADNSAKWGAILDPADLWLLHLRGMQACLTVGLAESDDLARAASTLEQVESVLSVDEHGSGLHRLVLTHLLKVYGPTLLDRPQRRIEIDAALRKAME